MLPGQERPRAPWRIIAALIFAEVALSYEIVMIFAALPRLNIVFQDPVQVGWLLSGFMMVSAAAAAVGGRLGDLYGRRRVVLIALALAAIGSLISAGSASLTGVLVGRTLQGCAACVLPLCIGLMREYMPPARVGFGVGLVLASAAIGTAGGKLVGGYIIDHHDWPVLFYVSGALAALAWLGVWCALPRPPARRRPAQRFDAIGGVLFVPGLAATLYAVHGLREHGFGARSVLLSGAVGLLILIVWYCYERRRPDPLIDVRQVFSGQVGLANLAMLLVALSVFQSVLIGSLLLQQPEQTGIGFGKSATFFGAVMAPGSLLGVLVSPLAGDLAARIGARRVLLGTSALSIGIWLGLALFAHSLWAVVALLTLTSLVGAATFTSIPNLIIENVPVERTSELVGFAVVVRHLAGGIGAQLAVMLLHGSTVSAGAAQYPSASAYMLLFVVYAGLGLATAAVIFRTRNASRETLLRAANAGVH